MGAKFCCDMHPGCWCWFPILGWSTKREHFTIPKAFLPATQEGDTFLDIKLLEQKYLIPTYANVVIVPSGFRLKFENLIAHSPLLNTTEKNTDSQIDWLVLEQTEKLSTIRFNLNGTPYIDNSLYSPVPAGHGELLHLCDDIVNHFTNSCALHFRNIDNILWTKPEQ